MAEHVEYAFEESETNYVLWGWVDYMNEDDFEALMFVSDRR